MSSPMDDSPTEDLTPVPPAWAQAELVKGDPPRAVEVKAVTVAVLATLLYVIGDAVQANTAILDPLPEWARTAILAVLPTLLGLAAAYRVPSNRV